MIKAPYVLVALLLFFAACNKNSERVTASGLKYTVIKEGDGKASKKGEFLVFDFELRDSKDSVWNESYESGLSPYAPMSDTSEIKHQDEITQLLHVLTAGDSVKTTMTIKHFFNDLARMQVPPGVDTTGTLTYTIKAHKIMPEQEFVAWRDKTVTERDEKMITKYLAENKLTATRDTSGIHYVLHSQSGGPKPSMDNCVEVNYIGKFLVNGLPFDQNPKMAFKLNEVIQGWALAIPLLAKGDSGTFFIPSKLAYGPRGCCPQAPGAIPRDAVLMFDVKLLDFKTEIDPVTRTCK
jgi:FKBP-type peptidyl-prolyl cis-trans isomerase